MASSYSSFIFIQNQIIRNYWLEFIENSSKSNQKELIEKIVNFLPEKLLDIFNQYVSIIEYDSYNFNKRVLSKSLICANLQKHKDNLLSLILFYNDYFKINLILCHDDKYYKSGIKDFNNIYILTGFRSKIIINKFDGKIFNFVPIKCLKEKKVK